MQFPVHPAHMAPSMAWVISAARRSSTNTIKCSRAAQMVGEPTWQSSSCLPKCDLDTVQGEVAHHSQLNPMGHSEFFGGEPVHHNVLVGSATILCDKFIGTNESIQRGIMVLFEMNIPQRLEGIGAACARSDNLWASHFSPSLRMAQQMVSCLTSLPDVCLRKASPPPWCE